MAKEQGIVDLQCTTKGLIGSGTIVRITRTFNCCVNEHGLATTHTILKEGSILFVIADVEHSIGAIKNNGSLTTFLWNGHLIREFFWQGQPLSHFAVPVLSMQQVIRPS